MSRASWTISVEDAASEAEARERCVDDPPPYRGIWTHPSHGPCHVFADRDDWPDGFLRTGWRKPSGLRDRPPSQLDRIEALLTEIRDRLPAQPQQPSVHQATLFGYRLGQDEPPDFHQAQLAGMLLRGELADWATRPVPVIAYRIAEEIAERAPKAER